MRRTLIAPAVALSLTVGFLTAGAAEAGQPADDNRGAVCASRSRSGRDLQVIGLVADGSLVCFRDSRPDRARTIGAVTGLVGDTSLVGLDHRPANSVLYGVGDAGGVYSVDANTAAATLVSRLDQPLQGNSFGVDFNPTVDRLRIVSDTGQNLRVNVDTGAATVDGPLNLPAAMPPVNPAIGVTAVAYTNNDFDPATATTLFDVDTTNDNVVIQAPANAGSLSPTGKLGVDAANEVGFDIYSELRDGTTSVNRPLASIAAPGQPDEPLPGGPAHRSGRQGGRVPPGGRRHRDPHGPALTTSRWSDRTAVRSDHRAATNSRTMMTSGEEGRGTLTDDAADDLRGTVDRAARRDPDAWEALYRRSHRNLAAYARRRLFDDQAAEDAVSETMARALDNIDRFTWQGAGFDAWLYGIARNVVREVGRSRGRTTSLADNDRASTDRGPEDEAVAGDEAGVVRAAFARLGDDDREVLELRVHAGLSADAVGALLGKRPGAVRMAQARALQRLRGLMEEVSDGGR